MFRPGFRPVHRPVRPWFGWGRRWGWGWLLLPLLVVGGCLAATFLLPLMRLFLGW
jgi:hypothetical protein